MEIGSQPGSEVAPRSMIDHSLPSPDINVCIIGFCRPLSFKPYLRYLLHVAGRRGPDVEDHWRMKKLSFADTRRLTIQ